MNKTDIAYMNIESEILASITSNRAMSEHCKEMSREIDELIAANERALAKPLVKKSQWLLQWWQMLGAGLIGGAMGSLLTLWVA